MARKSGFVRRGNIMRRETRWFGITATNTVLAAASTAVLFSGLTAELLALRPFTIIRSRGVLAADSDQAAATEFYHVSMGVAVVSDQALAIGVTAVPTPATDRASDLFFVYEEVLGKLSIASVASIVEPTFQTHYWDSKAMRKVEEGQDIAFTIETEATSNGATVKKAGRMLIKLH